MMSKRYPLKFASHFTHVVHMLELLPRTGWVQWDVSEPENVWEHILAVRELAIQYKQELQITEKEFEELLSMIEIHDWPEVLVGDGVILGDELNVVELRRQKKICELEAMKTLCANSPFGDELLKLYTRYSDGSDRVAQLVKQLEKLQAVFKAAEYERTQHKKGITNEFIHYTKALIQDSFLMREFEKISLSIVVHTILFYQSSSLF